MVEGEKESEIMKFSKLKNMKAINSTSNLVRFSSTLVGGKCIASEESILAPEKLKISRPTIQVKNLEEIKINNKDKATN